MRGAAGQRDVVGRLFVQGDPEGGHPLHLADGAVAARLGADAAAALAAAGAAPPEGAVEVVLDEAWVISEAAPWHALRGPIRARVAWRGRVLDRAGGVRWERRFAAARERRVVYFRAEDHAEALSEAWCQTLAAWAEAAAGEDFRAALAGW
jgi:hypothetical protein